MDNRDRNMKRPGEKRNSIAKSIAPRMLQRQINCNFMHTVLNMLFWVSRGLLCPGTGPAEMSWIEMLQLKCPRKGSQYYSW